MSLKRLVWCVWNECKYSFLEILSSWRRSKRIVTSAMQMSLVAALPLILRTLKRASLLMGLQYNATIEAVQTTSVIQFAPAPFEAQMPRGCSEVEACMSNGFTLLPCINAGTPLPLSLDLRNGNHTEIWSPKEKMMFHSQFKTETVIFVKYVVQAHIAGPPRVSSFSAPLFSR